MKKFFQIIPVFLILYSALSFGQSMGEKLENLRPNNKALSERDWGVGIRLGVPTGITVKRYFGQNALEFTMGSHFRNHVLIRGAFLFSNDIPDVKNLVWYYGLGASFDIGRNDFDFLIDAYIGSEYRFEDAPFSVFIDLGPSIELIDDPFYIWFHGSLGVRYDF